MAAATMMRGTPRTRRAWLQAAVTGGLLVMLGTGCSLSTTAPAEKSGAAGKDGSTGAAEQSPQATGEAPPAASDGGGAVVDEDAQRADIDPNALGKPVRSITTAAVVEGDPKATMTISIFPLRRTGKIITATYTFVVHSTAKGAEPADLYTYFGDKSWDPYAIDAQNLNRHGVITAKSGATQTSYQGAKFRPGQTFYAFAMFAAPPADVKTMDVYMAENAPLATGVPIR